MPLNRQEKTTTLSLTSSLLLGCTALLLFASAAQAQVIRPSNTLYLSLKGGATAYGGDLDKGYEVGDNQTILEPNGLEWATTDFGWLAGAELGYQFTDFLGFGLGFQYGTYSNLDSGYPVSPGDSEGTVNTAQITDSETLPTVSAAFRYMPFPSAKISPYANIGALFTFQGNRPDGADAGQDSDIGVGPLAGLGLELLLGRQLGLFIEANTSWIFDDVAVDGANPGGTSGFTGSLGDDSDYDNLNFYGGGLRYSFKPGFTPVAITGLECPAELTAGESGSFMVMTNMDATPPVNASWNWGDGSTGSGMSASHRFTTPGTYTVTSTATSDFNEDMESCLVTVVEPQIPPTLTACRVTPSQINTGGTVTLNGTVNRDASMPVTISVNWGDGDGDSGTTFPSTHSYSDQGTYTVTATATNAYGSDTCTATVTVGDSFCADVSELNSAFFGFGSSALTAEAIERLDENLEVLRRCPDICVLIQAYTDDREGDQIRLSQARADAIRDYYVANGIDMSRLRAVGLGEDPNSNSKEDPGPGDSRARRGDSVPASCGTFIPRN